MLVAYFALVVAFGWCVVWVIAVAGLMHHYDTNTTSSSSTGAGFGVGVGVSTAGLTPNPTMYTASSS